MTTLEYLKQKYGTGKPVFMKDYNDICRFFSVPRVEGWAKNGTWIVIPTAATGLHEILFAQTEEKLFNTQTWAEERK